MSYYTIEAKLINNDLVIRLLSTNEEGMSAIESETTVSLEQWFINKLNRFNLEDLKNGKTIR